MSLKNVEVEFTFFSYRAKFTMTDSFRTNHSDVSVTYTMMRAWRSRWPALPPPFQTLSLTNRCRATAHAVMLLPKHFNELTWPHVFRHVVSCLRCCRRDYGTYVYIRACIYVYVWDYRIYTGNFPTLLKISPDVSRLTQSNEIYNFSLIALPIISYFFKYINKRR